MPRSKAVSGRIERVSTGTVAGWLWCETDPTERVAFRLVVNQEFVGDFTANLPCVDLALAPIGDGGHGFSVPLPAELVLPGDNIVELQLPPDQVRFTSCSFTSTAPTLATTRPAEPARKPVEVTLLEPEDAPRDGSGTSWPHLNSLVDTKAFDELELALGRLANVPRKEAWRIHAYKGHIAEAKGNAAEALEHLRLSVLHGGDHFSNTYHLVRLFLAAGKTSEATVLVGTLVAKNPRSQSVHLLRNAILEKAGKWTEAALGCVTIAALCADGKRNIPAAMLKSLTNVIGKVDEQTAIKALLAIRAQFPGLGKVSELLLRTYRKHHRLTQAWQVAMDVEVRGIPENESIWVNLIGLSQSMEPRRRTLERLALIPATLLRSPAISELMLRLYLDYGMVDRAKALVLQAVKARYPQRRIMEVEFLLRTGAIKKARRIARKRAMESTRDPELGASLWRKVMRANQLLDSLGDNLVLHALLAPALQKHHQIRLAVADSVLELHGTVAASAWLKQYWSDAEKSADGLHFLLSLLLEESDLTKAREVAERIISTWPADFRSIAAITSISNVDQREAARSKLADWLREFPESIPGWNLYIQLSNWMGDHQRSLAVLDDLRPRFNVDDRMTSAVIITLMLNGQTRAAADLIRSTPLVLTDEWRVYQHIWAHELNGDTAQAKQVWATMLAAKPEPRLSRAITTWSQVNSVAPDLTADDVALVTKVRDEILRLPFFLAYYRKLGVRHFFFVDNGSDDGTREYLAAQPDCSVYLTTDSLYRAPDARWINRVLDDHRELTWCLCVDADEFLVYPGCESIPLPQFVGYLKHEGAEMVAGYMLDCIPENYAAMKTYLPGDDILAHSPWFEANYRRVTAFRPPYYDLHGGILERLLCTAEAVDVKSANLMQVKTPLIRSGAGLRYICANHNTTPGQVSKVTCALLHFKFAGDLEARVRKAVSSSYGYYRGGKHYLRYVKFFSEFQGDFINQDSHRYHDSSSLTRLGMISAPPDFYQAFQVAPPDGAA